MYVKINYESVKNYLRNDVCEKRLRNTRALKLEYKICKKNNEKLLVKWKSWYNVNEKKVD